MELLGLTLFALFSSAAVAIYAIRSQRLLAKELLDHVERNRSVGDSTTAALAEKRLDIERDALNARLLAQQEMLRRRSGIEGALE